MSHKIINPPLILRADGVFDPADVKSELILEADQIPVQRAGVIVAEAIKDNIADFNDVNIAGIADQGTLQWDTAASEFAVVHVARPFLRAMTVDTNAVENSTSELDMVANPTISVPADIIEESGNIMRIVASGIVANTASAGVKVIFSWQGGAQTFYTSQVFDCGGAGRFWRIELDCVYVGGTNLQVYQKLAYFASTSALTNLGHVARGITAYVPANSNSLVVSAQWNAADAANTITMQQLTLQMLNANAN